MTVRERQIYRLTYKKLKDRQTTGKEEKEKKEKQLSK